MTGPVEHLIPNKLFSSNDTVVLSGDQILSYSQFFRAVSLTETRLRDLGIQPGDRVGIRVIDRVRVRDKVFRVSAP